MKTQDSVLWLNGLGDGKLTTYEKLVFRNLRKHSFTPYHGHIDWYNTPDFLDILDDKTNQAEELLAESNKLIIVGRSAGACVMTCIMGRLRTEENVFGVNFDGRIYPGTLRPRDPRQLAKVSAKSPAFYQGVQASGKVADSLWAAEKERLVTMTPYFDDRVPMHTMLIKDVENVRIPTIFHPLAAAVGAVQLAGTIKSLARQS